MHVINDNVDFYRQIQNGSIPEHDLLLTNPPYSDDHIEKLLTYATSQDKPFCLLMPNWVARKAEYKSLVGTTPHFFLSPMSPYTYTMPSWNERPEHVKDDGMTTPYLSSWYISLNVDDAELGKVVNRLDCIAKGQVPPFWVVAKTVKGLKWKIQKASSKMKR